MKKVICILIALVLSSCSFQIGMTYTGKTDKDSRDYSPEARRTIHVTNKD